MDEFQHARQHTGTGTPRSDDDGRPDDAPPLGEGVDPAVVVGAQTDSAPAGSPEVDVNRSGYGGSGGPGAGDPSEEGSTGATMEEMLQGGAAGDDGTPRE